MAGRPPKPTALKVLAGNPGKRRLNHSEPHFDSGTMYCPRHLTAEARREWRRVGRELENLGLLTSVDRSALAGYCQSWSDWVEARVELAKTSKVLVSDKGYRYVNPWVGIANSALDSMRRFMVEFGMTPSSRTRVHAEKNEKEKSLAEVLFEGVNGGG